MSNLYRATLEIDGINGVLTTLVKQALAESCSLLNSGRNDTRDCAVVLYDDGTLATRMMDQNESFGPDSESVVLCRVKNWVAWEMIPDNRQAIADNDKAQEIIVAKAIEQAKADDDEDAIPTLADWSEAYSYIDQIPDDVKELLAIDYRDWAVDEDDDWTQDRVGECLDRLDELAQENEA